MKKLVFVVICLIFMCCGCGSSPEEAIIGYWMRGDGYTISFSDATNCSFGEGELQSYTVYDKNHLQVVDLSGSGVMEFVFEVDRDILKIKLASENEYTIFTKNADEQQKILEERRELEALRIEEQRKQSQIDEIQLQIDSYMQEISEYEKKIAGNAQAIDRNKEDIVKWEEAIEQEYIDCQAAIDLGDDKEYKEGQRDDSIAAYNESIQSCKERIAKLEEENKNHQEYITLINSKIDELKAEIETIGNK